jgi:hypothetical protein
MKITKSLIRMFENDQENCGTEIAIYNLIWQISAELLKDIGIKQIKTSDKYKN